MPIYEYEALNQDRSCDKCRSGFEIIQGHDEAPLTECIYCGREVRKVISWCRAAIMETSPDHHQVEQKITEYEKEGRWSHAAELADKHSEKTKDKAMKARALDSYKKAGYDVKTLDKHVRKNNT
jgi:putative FmdB family regulatory protein